MGRKLLDLTGQKYGRLTVIKETEKTTDRNWLCKCDCGNEKIVRQNQLRTGRTKSCGCLQRESSSKANSANLKGKKFNKLTVLKRIGSDSKKQAVWLCKCECGEETKVTSDNLANGKIKSCGCLLETTGKELRETLERDYRKDGVLIPTLKRKRNINNKTGVKGVSLYKNKYRAYINIKNKSIYLGTFDTIEEAANARKKAEENYHKPYLYLEEKENEGN